MNIIQSMAATCALWIVMSSTAQAGMDTTTELVVHIDNATSTAQGSLIGARRSPDNRQFIGCGTTATRGQPSNLSVSCQAADAIGNDAQCVSTDPKFITAASLINETSYVLFQWDAQSNCTLLSVNNHSRFIHLP